jgi:uncharacterized membrane protein YedE/YeeE
VEAVAEHGRETEARWNETARSVLAGERRRAALACDLRRPHDPPTSPNAGTRMDHFTPWSALAGGALIGVAASVLLAANGRVAGVSGIIRRLLTPQSESAQKDDPWWRVSFVLGLVAAGLVAVWFWPGSVEISPRPIGIVAIAGALVGLGTTLGDGCTSGHGVCGLSRFSPRALVATLVFMAAGIGTATFARTVLGL